MSKEGSLLPEELAGRGEGGGRPKEISISGRSQEDRAPELGQQELKTRRQGLMDEFLAKIPSKYFGSVSSYIIDRERPDKLFVTCNNKRSKDLLALDLKEVKGLAPAETKRCLEIVAEIKKIDLQLKTLE